MNKDKLKQSLTIEQVHRFMTDLGGNPQPIQNDLFISQTICHNLIGEGSYKLYYYGNAHLFYCYTSCSCSFDIYELIQKVKGCSFFEAIVYVANYFGYENELYEIKQQEKLKDWKLLEKYEEIKDSEDKKQIVQLKIYDDKVLKNLPRPRIKIWEQEGIKRDIIKKYNIAYDPVNNGIIIPHYNINGDLIGIRERTLLLEQEKYGKYKPAKINNILYNHPLKYNLFNLNNSKNNIKFTRKVFIFESEKACLLHESYFGEENDISVAVCGSSLTSYQVDLLRDCNAEELVIAFDKEGSENEKERYVKKFYKMYYKYRSLVSLSFMYDKNNKYLDWKQSPIDNGQEVFIQMFKERIRL